MRRLTFSTLFNLLIDNVPNAAGEKYSLTEMSRLTNISVNQLGHYKRGTHGNPTLDNVTIILNLFQMPHAYLDCINKVDAMKMITAIHGPRHEESYELPPVRFRNPQGLDISDEALYQVKEILAWVFAREEALKNGDDEPPLPDFSK